MKDKLKYVLFIGLAVLGFVLFMVGLKRWGGVLRGFLEAENERRKQQEIADRQEQIQLDQARKEKLQEIEEYARKRRDEKLAAQLAYREGIRTAETQAAKKVEDAKTQEDLDAETDAAIERHNKYLNGQGGHVRRPLLPILLLAGLVILMLSSQAQPAPPSSQPTQAQRERTRKNLVLLERYRLTVERLRREIEIEKQHATQLVALKEKHARKEERIRCAAQVRRCKAEVKACTTKQSLLLRHTCPPCWPHALVSGLVVAGICGGVVGIREATRSLP